MRQMGINHVTLQKDSFREYFPNALSIGQRGSVRETHCLARILVKYQLGTVIKISKL